MRNLLAVESTTVTRWRWLVFEDALPHCVPRDLAPQLIADLKARSAAVTVERDEELSEFSIDIPGMCMVDRPIEVFRFSGHLSVHIPSEDVLTFAQSLAALNLRSFSSGEPYYKLHGFLRCWVLTPAHRERLVALLRSRVSAAEQRAEEFLQQWRRAAAKGSS